MSARGDLPCATAGLPGRVLKLGSTNKFIIEPRLTLSARSTSNVRVAKEAAQLQFDSPAFLEDPYPAYARLRAGAPITRDERGLWLVSRYDECLRTFRDRRWGHADRDPELASAVQAPAMRVRVFPDREAEDPWPFMRLNPPEHTRVRAVVNRAFTPAMVDGFEDIILDLVDRCLDEAFARGEVDLVESLAAWLPIRSICARLGAPEEDWSRLRDWSMEYGRGFDPGFATDTEQFDRCERAAHGLRDYFANLIAHRRSHPRDDLLSELVAARDGGDFLDDEELVVTVAMLLSAGNETSISLLGNGVLTLLRHPDQLARLRAAPELDQLAVEELLRFDSAFQFGDRVALEDFELHGSQITRGDRILILVGSANRDPDAFRDPDIVDLGRSPNRHLSFGVGLHYCVGAPFARLQARTVLRRLLDRTGDITLIGEPLRAGTAWNHGLAQLPVRLTPAPAASSQPSG